MHNISDIIIPDRNKKDLDDIPETIKKKINFTYVKHIDEVIYKALLKKISDSSKKPTKTTTAKKSATKKSR